MTRTPSGKLRRSFAIAGAAVVLPLLAVFLSNSLWGYLPLSRDVAKMPRYVLVTNAMRDLDVAVLRSMLIVQTRFISASGAAGSEARADLEGSFKDVSQAFSAVESSLRDWPEARDRTLRIQERWKVIREQARAIASGHARNGQGASPAQGTAVAPSGLSLRLSGFHESLPALDPVSFDADVAMLSGRISAVIADVTADVNARLTAGRIASQRVYFLTVCIGLMVIIFIMYVNLRLARYVVDPVNGIVGSITRFCGGDYSARTRVSRNDEIGALAEAFNEMADNIEQTHAHLASLTERDPLTHMLNRRGFDPRFAVHLERAEAGKLDMAVIMVDVDHFKKINDTYGHAIGDQVLVAIADTIRNCLRAGDFSARLGGEEFVICLPGEGRETGLTVAERLREAVSRMPLRDTVGNAFSVTISAGVAVYPECGRSQGEILQRGDDALYAAKTSGRNRIQLACANDAWRKVG